MLKNTFEIPEESSNANSLPGFTLKQMSKMCKKKRNKRVISSSPNSTFHQIWCRFYVEKHCVAKAVEDTVLVFILRYFWSPLWVQNMCHYWEIPCAQDFWRSVCLNGNLARSRREPLKELGVIYSLNTITDDKSFQNTQPLYLQTSARLDDVWRLIKINFMWSCRCIW